MPQEASSVTMGRGWRGRKSFHKVCLKEFPPEFLSQGGGGWVGGAKIRGRRNCIARTPSFGGCLLLKGDLHHGMGPWKRLR